MPYVIRNSGSGSKPYKIIKADTGKVVGSSATAEDAHASARARMAAEHGWKPTGKPAMKKGK
jgi:hypothetical protein